MTRLIDLQMTTELWPVPAHWRRENPPHARISDLPRSRPGLLARFVAAVLAIDARARDAQKMEQMCDRMRSDIGLPLNGDEARQMERRIQELQRWS